MIEGLDLVYLTKHITDQVEHVTCAECCKYFIAPQTATCGHTLCHNCWKGRRTCHICAAPTNKKNLKLNIPLQSLTEHIHTLGDAFEKLFNVKLDDFLLGDVDYHTNDPTRHVKEWLASSENHFSGPVTASQASDNYLIPPIELSESKIQIHSHSKKFTSPQKVACLPQPQEDWDKIEVLPDTEDTTEKPKQCAAGPMDFEPFLLDDNEYTTDNPRRSSRKRDLKSDSNAPTRDVSVEKNSGKDSSNNRDNKSVKTKQTWSNVKKMRKEFSKLNKVNKSKLNVSIEMCKKAQTNKSKPAKEATDSEPLCLNIDDNTPDITNKEKSEKKSNPIQLDEINMEEKKTENKVENENNQFTNKNISSSRHKTNVDDDNVKDNETKHVSLSQRKDTSNTSKVESMKSTSMKKTPPMPFIKKGALCKQPIEKNGNENQIKVTQNEIESNNITTNADDIKISITIGNTITNIVIKNKRNDVQMKVSTDQEIQTSLGPYGLINKHDASCSPVQNVNVRNIELNIGEGNKVHVNKALSVKKSTASADTATATAQFEITDSLDKELSDVMECLESKTAKKATQKSIKPTNIQVSPVPTPVAAENEDEMKSKEIDDIDIFNSGSVKETSVKLLKDTKPAGSEIIQTLKSKKSQKNVEKRDRDEANEVAMPCSKKQKIDSVIFAKDSEEELRLHSEQHPKTVNDSDNMNYDVIMSQVFANIDADIQNSGTKDKEVRTVVLKQKTGEAVSQSGQIEPLASQIIHKTQVFAKNKAGSAPGSAQNISQLKEVDNQKYSENMFSMLEKDSEPREATGKNKQLPVPSSTQQQIDNLLTPRMCREMAVTEDNTQANNDIEIMEPQLGTPMVDDDSDKSVVEETPQKNMLFAKPKQADVLKPAIRSKSSPRDLQAESEIQKDINRTSDSQIIRSIINISDTLEDNSKNKEATVVEIAKERQPTETPLTIKKFVDHITHNSTPIARKSLNFENDNLDDPEQTLCPTSTQEKEFMAKAFERTPQSPVRKPLQLKNVSSSTKSPKRLYIAASCLTSAEVKEVKRLCLERKWTFLEKYTDDLTHLVVGVDDENKSQRSVKYMCALAASKWIVTYEWVVKCLKSKTQTAEEWPYEALDAGGEPGPKRSRTSLKKVFEGITFYCMPPFSVLDIHTLKTMLTAAGGRVVDSSKGVAVTEENGFKPALLLAEPEHTQEDRFIFMAMEEKVVPVNYEWVLNCLGAYSLCSAAELLLCPPALLPAPAARWPHPMMAMEDDD